MILFFLYLAVLTYFLFFSEKYGRTAEREFSYNLTPFLEIRRFWNYREFLGLKAVFINLAGNVLAFVPFGAILPVISRRMRGFFPGEASGLFLQPSGGVYPACDPGGDL